MKDTQTKAVKLTVRPHSASAGLASPSYATARVAADRPTVSEYIAWRLHVLHSTDMDTDTDYSGDVLPSGAEIRSTLQMRRH